MLQAGIEAGNKLDVDEPLLVMPDDPLEQEEAVEPPGSGHAQCSGCSGSWS